MNLFIKTHSPKDKTFKEKEVNGVNVIAEDITIKIQSSEWGSDIPLPEPIFTLGICGKEKAVFTKEEIIKIIFDKFYNRV